MAKIKTDRSLDVMALNADRNIKEILQGIDSYSPEAQSKLYYDLQQAIQHKNMSAIDSLIATSLPSSLTNEVLSKITHQLSTAAFVRQTIEKAKIVNSFQKKKDSGAKLNPTEERWLERKDDIEKNILKIEEKNPQLSDEEVLPKEDVQKLPPRTQEEEKEYQERQQERRELDQDQLAANPTPDPENVLDSIPEDDRFREKKDVDWHKIREEAIWSGLKKAADQKNPADMAEALFLFISLEMLPKLLSSWGDQLRDKHKAEKDAYKNNRDTSIDNMLKAHDTNKTEVVQKLAKDMARWLYDDSWKAAEEAQKSGKQLTPYQKFTLKKKAFADKLPKKEDGNLDFKKFSKRQKRQYAKYMSIYATIPPFRNYIAKVMGVRLTKKEIRDYALQALNVKVKHVNPNGQQQGSQRPMTQQPMPRQPISQQPAPQQPAPQQPATQQPAPQQPAPQQPAPQQPAPQQPTPQQPAPQQPAPQQPTPQQPAPQQPAPQQPAPQQPSPQQPAPQQPAPQQPARQQPTTPQPVAQADITANKKTLRDELKVILTRGGVDLPDKALPLVEGVNISGSAKDPQLVLHNGKKISLKIKTDTDQKAQEVMKRLTEWKKKMEALRANQEAINRARNNSRDTNQTMGRNLGRDGM